MRSANYVEETTTSIAGTLGNGAVTLTAITNVPRLSTVFGTQATTIRYVIEDTVNKKFETGIGSVAANVLTRTHPQITWDGTTYHDSAPSALQFGATPNAGDIKIRLAATAESQAANLPGTNATVAGDSTWRDYPLSEGRAWNSNGTGYAMTADREYYVAYHLPMGGSLAGVQFEVTSGVASSNAKLALYSCASDGLPGAKIVDFTTTATVTATVKTDTATGSWSPAGPVWLTPGWYYVGILPSHGITVRGDSSSGAAQGRTPMGRKNGYGYGPGCYVAGSYATGLPAVPSLGSATMLDLGITGSSLWLGLKVTP